MATLEQEQIANSRLIRNQIAIWRYEDTDPLDMAAITTGFVPSTPAGWEDVTGEIDMSQGMKISAGDTGMSAGFTVYRQDRSEWRGEKPLAVAARHWNAIGGSWGAWYSLLVGTIHGGGEQRQRRRQSWGGVTFSNNRLVDLTRVPAHKFGRPNLMRTATLTGGSNPLSNPSLESPLEFKTQAAGVDGDMAIDGYGDTVAISDTIAAKAPPSAIPGDIAKVRIVRIYNGRPGSRAIGAGNRPIWIEVTAGVRVNDDWGDFESPGDIPNFFEGYAAVHDAHNSKGEIVAGAGIGGGNAYRFTAKVENQSGVNRIMAYMQYNLESTQWIDRPFEWSVWIKTDDAASIGRTIQIMGSPIYGAQKSIRNIALTSDWRKYTIPGDSTGNYGGGMIRIRPEDQSISASPLKWLVDDLYLSVGYAERDGYVIPEGRYTLVLDDGIGHIRWFRPAWEGGGGGQFVIPPYKTVVFTDDTAVLEKAINPGGAQVIPLKSVYPEFFFAQAYGGNPAYGRIRGQHGGWGANGTPFDWNDNGSGTIIDDINLAIVNGGVPWTEDQALLRQSPLGTGQLAPEDNPTIGLNIADQYGRTYWYYSLAAFEPTVLVQDIGTGVGVDLYVRDFDALDPSGHIRIGSEWIAYSGISDTGKLTVTARGEFGTTPATHNGGDTVTLRVDGAAQTGQRIDLFEMRRKAGTPAIVAGMILATNQPAPGDPGVGGSVFENHPDWAVVGRFENNASDTVQIVPPGGWVQARHVCYVITDMALHNGAEQRGKANEFVARQYLPGGSSGRYTSHTANNAEGVIGHLAIQHAGIPATKYALGGTIGNTPIGDLSLAEGMAGSLIQSVAGNGMLAAYLDGLGYMRVLALPNSPYFDGQTIEWTWTAANLWSDPKVSYRDANEIAQVRVIARDAYTHRVYDESYPPLPLPYGEIIQIKDVTVVSRQAAANLAKRRFYAASAKRSLAIDTGAIPFVGMYQRHVADLPGVDLGGGASNINYYVAGYDISVRREKWGLSFRTNVKLHELALNGPNGG